MIDRVKSLGEVNCRGQRVVRGQWLVETPDYIMGSGRRVEWLG